MKMAIIAREHPIRCQNTREDRPQDRYYIDPQELVRIQRQGREQGLDIVGFYHSHPDHPAQWSKTDFAEAHWIGCSYVITRVDKAKSSTRIVLVARRGRRRQAVRR